MLTRNLFAPEPQSREARPYQTDGLEALRQSIRQGVRRIVLQLPTGAGKTFISSSIAAGALAKGRRVSFCVPRISLVDQTVDEFAREGVTAVGVMQADHPLTDMEQPVQICSADTLKNRAFPNSDVVIIDEVHMWRGIYQKWIEARPDAVFIGLSATPWAKGLGKHFESLLIVATMKELMEQNYLCQYRAFGVGDPDVSGIKVIAGDYHEGQLSERMRNDEALVGDIVDTWRRLHGQDRTLAFAVDLAHARVIQERFEAAGIPCGYQDASTPNDEREGIKRQFHSGALPVVVSVGTLIIGVDWDVRCISWCRPTRSEMLFVQGLGRGTRLAAPGTDAKEHLIFLDHAGVIKRLGYPEDILYEQLHDGKTEPRKAREPSLPKPCPKCTCMMRGRVCPNCGHEKVRVSGVEEQDGTLVELRRDGKREKASGGGKRTYTIAEKVQWWAELQAYVRERGNNPGRAAHLYREKFGVWPDHSIRHTPPSATVSLVVRGWVKSRNIRWAKSRTAITKGQGYEATSQ